MNTEAERDVDCQICHRSVAARLATPAGIIRPAVVELIRKTCPEWSSDGFICLEDLNRFRGAYVEDVLREEKGDLSDLEKEVVRSVREQELIAEDINAEFDRKLTFGDMLADKVAEFGGSWSFIICFGCVMFVWIGINTIHLLSRPFDPYPYILLNLVLSCLAAMQAPVIMMSQNRQEAKDRLRAEHDYRVNLKAELEIRHLNAKLDLLLTHQWQRLLEIQQVQTDLIQELTERHARSAPPTADHAQ
jgi:uncharacterized membrane protein